MMRRHSDPKVLSVGRSGQPLGDLVTLVLNRDGDFSGRWVYLTPEEAERVGWLLLEYAEKAKANNP